MYRDDQGWFLNCVLTVETDLGPAALLAWLKRTERRLGRDPKGERNGPRLIDIDILFYGDQVVSSPSLEVPHPRLAERAFVLVPLNEIRPRLVHPVLGKTPAELLRALHTDKGVKKLGALSPSPPRPHGRPGQSPSRRGSSRGGRRSSPRSP
jgi:2-amino-4-hydroxy-6-hydroxymethyldihydropteridine diphosphokinase